MHFKMHNTIFFSFNNITCLYHLFYTFMVLNLVHSSFNMKISFLNGGNNFLLRIPLQIQLHICTLYSNRVYAPIFTVRSTTILHQCDVSFSACPVPWMQFSRAENSEFLFGILFNRKCCFRELKLHIHTY